MALHLIDPIVWFQSILAINSRALHAASLTFASLYLFPFQKTELELPLMGLSALFGLAAFKKAFDALHIVLVLYWIEWKENNAERRRDKCAASYLAREQLRRAGVIR